MIYIGVDPGLDGAIAFLDEDGWIIEVIDMPTVLRPSKNKKTRQLNAPGTANLLREYHQQEDGKLIAWVEQVSAMPGQGVTSMFSFGEGFGIVRGVLATLGIPIKLVHSATWKKQFKLTGLPKDSARAVVQEMYPCAPVERKKDVGRADALLIAKFGYLNRDNT